MRVRKCVAIAAFSVLALVVLSRQAEALTINFASLETEGTLVNTCCGQLRTQGTFVTVDGFNFVSSNEEPTSYGLSVWAAGDAGHPTGGSAGTSLFEYAAGATTTITKSGEGSTFTLTGIDFTEWSENMPGGLGTFDVTLLGYKTDLTTVSQTVKVTRDGSLNLQSFVLTGFDDVAKVTMIQGVYAGGTAFQFNNLIVDEEPSSVPDAGSTLPLLVLAGAGLAAMRRRPLF